ncbi:M16 family metallopeptidase [Candidatus Chrysopegis kryptomonas]|jgi:predicted Zn-dependent peptidase|uniref:Predicted Zn-dependent peptidase n=1 Tax=Candidatus Chryseopegocella kryptomonas TaxID=1633643 RepID=A0A0P1NWV8_9BACT|nr:pitrilysin family protein [Candidatus Chrysopegis kryptomonas]CUT04084.1 Predicted Zn-dependent peptidase [Candidatus Chrysopegis kryptomonas]
MLKKIGTLLMLILFLTSVSDSQEKIDRTKPPKPGPESKVKFPSYFEKTLPNGLKVIVVENHEQPIVYVSFVVRSGSTYDGDLPGLASVTAELLTKGTKTRSATQIAEEIDFVGGSLNTSASWDATNVSVLVLKKYIGVGMDILQDVVLNPTFPDEELERIKTQRLASIKQSKADAGYLASVRFSKELFSGHPYANESGGNEESIQKMKRDDIVNFYKTHFIPNNSFIIFAGDITPSEAVPLVERYFGRWEKGKNPQKKFQNVNDVSQTKVVIVDKPGAVQSAIRIGHLGIDRKNKDYVKIYTMNMLLGGYFNSRINMNLRETHGYTYGASSFFDSRMYPGPFIVSADVRNEVTDSSVAEILKELRRIIDEPVPEDELKMAKDYIVGSFPLQIETPAQVASRIMTIEIYGLPKDFYDRFREEVKKITAKDIQEVAKKYLHPDKILIVISGNSKQIKPVLEKFGPVVVYDADGNKIE